ncbi:MAG: N-acetylglucosamine kinase [Bacteroidota bacterium]
MFIRIEVTSLGYLLGLDQGGSKTAAVVADCDGRLLGVGYAGGACHASDGLERAMAMAGRATAEALARAGLTAGQVGLLVAGMTGADWPEEYDLLRAALADALGIGNVTVVNDCLIAMRGGTDMPYGAVLCAGSGLNAAVKSPDGRLFVFGYYVDDEDQGATALGRRAIKAVVAAEAGLDPPTSLTRAVLKYFGLHTVEELLRKQVCGALAAKDLAGLAPLLIAEAGAGDPAASGLVVGFGRRIARYAVAGLRRFAMLDTAVEVVLSGGVFKGGGSLLAGAVTAAVRAAAPKAMVIDARLEPVAGAVLMALDDIHGGTLERRVRERVLAGSAVFGLIRR